MFLSLKSRHTCVSIGRGPVRRLQVYTSVQCRQRAHGTDPCRVLMRCWLGLSCKLWCNATKLTSPRDVTSSKYENVSTCCKLWGNTKNINFGHLIVVLCLNFCFLEWSSRFVCWWLWQFKMFIVTTFLFLLTLSGQKGKSKDNQMSINLCKVWYWQRHRVTHKKRWQTYWPQFNRIPDV